MPVTYWITSKKSSTLNYLIYYLFDINEVSCYKIMRLPDKNQLRCNQPALLKIARMRTGRHFFVNSLGIRLSQAYIRLNA